MKITGIFSVIIIYLIGCGLFLIQADELKDMFKGVGPMGMGNAFTAISNDFNAVMYNPAGILRQRTFNTRKIFHRAEFANLYGEISKNTKKLYGEINNFDDLQVEKIADALEETEDQFLYARFGFFPYVKFFNFQISFLTDTQFRAEMTERESAVADAEGASLTEAAGGIAAGTRLTSDHLTTLTNAGVTKVTIDKMHIDAVANIVPMIGFAWGLLQDRLAFGVNVRYVMRTEINEYIAPKGILDGTFQNKMNSYVSKGAGIGYDVGLLYIVSDFWFPSFGVSVRDVGGTKITTSKVAKSYETSGTLVNVRDDPQYINVGFSIMPRISRNVAVRMATDVQHVTDQGVDFIKKVHAGAELLLGNPLRETFFTLRGGYNMGLWTAGISIDTGFIVLEASSYGEEVGQGLTSVEDRRYMVRLGGYL